MNTPIRRVALTVMLLIVALMVNLTYIQVIWSDELRAHPRNSRTLNEELARQRGDIIVGNEAVATVEETGDNLYPYERVYPDGPVYAPITGYYSPIGRTGLERAEDPVLNGSDDRLFVRRLSDLITGRDARGGMVELTIDRRMQETAYQMMTDRGLTGAVVALEPSTGRILSLVSTPTFDPNELSTLDSEARAAATEELEADENRPLHNRAISETQPPGSTFKLLVAAAALDNGYSNDSEVNAAPSVQLPGSSVSLPNYNNNPCGNGQRATLLQAMEESCNVPFGEIAGELGPEVLQEQAEALGFSDPDLEIPLSVASSELGEMADSAAVYQSGIGQRDVRVTPLQNAMMVATIANEGSRMEPHVVSRILTPELDLLDEINPDEAEQAFSPQVAQDLTEMMIASEQHTGGEGQIPGVTIASKTGTAQWGVDPSETNPHAWYVAFAPAEDPQVAVAVLVEAGGDIGAGATGGRVAAPIGRAVLGAGLGGG
ncbi:peptidoglycan D,D-transpeptidase FtsI family protein [Actinoalloteichus hymeniacidonis]|uniref:Cell division protein FtsI/penicillin-binding protein 2 n=1 Tax=Actinoalloteichus hymeniacidonis TaxID=340345 RepID=A0AAC9HLD7_9PSEU|nr:penicillin-binding protein 2 [Actinoalloteichus hymeniacidonis]AOS60876.1 cell division protein FtsI/penicillin-binding protein 2 [Actinoalloteichus hymeniacidonis]MBB5911124.1 peptidoglycan glycosyltransferase [Actinoalloteichus hymeniacidonis]